MASKSLRTLVLATLAAAFFSGCSTVVLTERNFSLVTATEVKKGEPPRGITETFPLDSRIYLYSTATWDDVGAEAGTKKFETKWYRGEKLVASLQPMTVPFGRPPHYAWQSLNAVAIGVGEGRVDVYIDVLFVGSKKFKVVEKTQ